MSNLFEVSEQESKPVASVAMGQSVGLHPKQWKAVQFELFPSWREKPFMYMWGMDIWYGNVPFCKTILAVNIAVWLLISL